GAADALASPDGVVDQDRPRVDEPEAARRLDVVQIRGTPPLLVGNLRLQDEIAREWIGLGARRAGRVGLETRPVRRIVLLVAVGNPEAVVLVVVPRVDILG